MGKETDHPLPGRRPAAAGAGGGRGAAAAARLAVPAAVGLGALLLFQVQFVVAKWFLPWFGGAASVWTTCMLFFQLLLLAGYLYAHGVTQRLAPHRQAALHVGLLFLATAGLVLAGALWPSPVTPDASWRPAPDASPIPGLIALLGVSTGLPYFVLSTTGPLLQAWSVRLEPGRAPWRLYAVSNGGSLLGLVSYPAAVEPLLALTAQGWAWAAAFLVYALLVAFVAVAQAACPPDEAEADGGVSGAAPTVETVETVGTVETAARRREPGAATWAVLAATASLGLLAVTNKLTLDLASFPFLWMVPLAVYLATFIACFGRESRYSRTLWGALLVLSSLTLTASLVGLLPLQLPGQVGTLLLFLGSLCMVCHGELAALKPHPSRLTAYYLSISAGGAIGCLAVAVVAPAFFRGLWELPIALYGGVLILLVSIFRDEPPLLFGTPARARGTIAGAGLLLVGFAGVHGLVVLTDQPSILASGRNFYGWFVLRQGTLPELPGVPLRQLFHGWILHGEQFEEPSRRRFPTAYFGFSSGVALGLRTEPAYRPGPEVRAVRVGVVGLGAGTLATYSRRGDVYRFYEINPAITALSTGERPLLTFLSGALGQTEVVGGDARLALEREAPQRYDVLVLDAFSSDAIPVHLLTREAFGVYRRHLARPSSLVALNISNLHLDLEPAVRAAAGAQGFHAILVDGKPRYEAELASHWLLLSLVAERLEHPELVAVTRPWRPPARAGRVWTDDYCNVLGALTFFRPAPRGATGGPSSRDPKIPRQGP